MFNKRAGPLFILVAKKCLEIPFEAFTDVLFTTCQNTSFLPFNN